MCAFQQMQNMAGVWAEMSLVSRDVVASCYELPPLAPALAAPEIPAEAAAMFLPGGRSISVLGKETLCQQLPCSALLQRLPISSLQHEPSVLCL